MPQTIFNTFDSGLELAIVSKLGTYLTALSFSPAPRVVAGRTTAVQDLPAVVVAATELEEVVYQSGVYRCAIDLEVRIDMDGTNAVALCRTLPAAVLDFIQQTDLASQLSGVVDGDGNKYVSIKGIVPNIAQLNDVGDRRWSKRFAVDFFGFAPANG